jgi:hypothetical protein
MGRRHTYSTQPGGILSGRFPQVRNAEGQPVQLLGSQQVADEINRAQEVLKEGEEFRQGRRHGRRLQEAAELVVNSGDKRRRPREVSKKDFKEIRRLKLTRTYRGRPKKK